MVRAPFLAMRAFLQSCMLSATQDGGSSLIFLFSCAQGCLRRHAGRWPEEVSSIFIHYCACDLERPIFLGTGALGAAFAAFGACRWGFGLHNGATPTSGNVLDSTQHWQG